MTARRVPDEAAGQRADVALAALLEVSRSRAAAMLDSGRVTRAGVALRRSDRLGAGDLLDVAADDRPRPVAAVPPLPPVRWEDDDLLVIAKPAGLVVHPGAGHESGTLVDALVAAGVPLAPSGGQGRPGIVHRLDRDTSGLLAVAKTDRGHHGMVEALRRREVTRSYLALVEGALPSAVGRVDAPIGRDPRDRQRFAAIEGGKPAVTHWRTRTTCRHGAARLTLVACRLETGRTHQIRVHLAFAGAPVAGDRRYGASPAVADQLGLSRPFLHAAVLGFAHPLTGEAVLVTEPLPADLGRVADRLGIPASEREP